MVYYEDDAFLKGHSGLMNRLSGLADEMGSYFLQLRQLERRAMEKAKDMPDKVKNEEKEVLALDNAGKAVDGLPEEQLTPFAIARNIIHQ